jgi:hypothetical protein
MPAIEQILPLFRSLLEEVSALSKALRFDSGNEHHLLALALNGAVLEQARGIMVVLEQRNITPAFTLLRSLLEAVVDLFNLVDDRNYIEFMRSAWLDEKRRILSAATQTSDANPHLKEFANYLEDIHGHLKHVRAEIQQLKDRGIVPLTVAQRFERAKQSSLYRGPYWFLCHHSHNNIVALCERHFCETPSGIQVVYFMPPDEEDVQLLLDTAAVYVAESITLLYQLLGKTELERITLRLKEILDLMRAVYTQKQAK